MSIFKLLFLFNQNIMTQCSKLFSAGTWYQGALSWTTSSRLGYLYFLSPGRTGYFLCEFQLCKRKKNGEETNYNSQKSSILSAWFPIPSKRGRITRGRRLLLHSEQHGQNLILSHLFELLPVTSFHIILIYILFLFTANQLSPFILVASFLLLPPCGGRWGEAQSRVIESTEPWQISSLLSEIFQAHFPDWLIEPLVNEY